MTENIMDLNLKSPLLVSVIFFFWMPRGELNVTENIRWKPLGMLEKDCTKYIL